MERTQKSRKYFVTARVAFHAFHKWESAPSEVGFLRDMHRHKFTVEAIVFVEHSDREVEFITLQKDMKKLSKQYDECRLHNASCEMLADEFMDYLLTKAYDVRSIRVWEDEDCSGGVFIIDPDTPSTT